MYSLLPIAYCLLLIAYGPLPIVYRLLPFTYCLLASWKRGGLDMQEFCDASSTGFFYVVLLAKTGFSIAL